MATVFDGRSFAALKEDDLKQKVKKLVAQGKIPKLVSILVGDDPASVLYVNLKKRAAERIGCQLVIRRPRTDIGPDNLIAEIRKLNKDQSVNGIMVQLPLPGNFKDSSQDIINAIDPQKDVDGLRKDSPFLHPTSKAILQIIEEVNDGSNVCVVGSTGMVGRPLINELKRRGYQTSECDSNTKDLKDRTLAADILVSVTGENNLIKGNMVKEGAVVIDVGSPKGDVDFEKVAPKVRFITPVPGGVGPVTISCLLENLVKAA